MLRSVLRSANRRTDRNHDLSEDDLDTAEQAWEQHWAAARAVELTAAVQRHAGQLAPSQTLRSADAGPLASALAIADPHLIIAGRDRRPPPRAATPGLSMGHASR